jgi:hypothetical protein
LLLQGRECFLQHWLPRETNEDWQCLKEPYASVLKCSFRTMSILQKEIGTMYNFSDSWFSSKLATWKITRAHMRALSFFSWLATWESLYGCILAVCFEQVKLLIQW